MDRECEICDRSMVRDYSAEVLLALPQDTLLKVYRCKSCGFRKLDPIPDSAYIEKIYSASYFEDDARGFSYAAQVGETKFAFCGIANEFNRRITSGGCVLDIGCATGEFIEELKNVGLRARGLEYSEYGANICKRKGLDVFQGDIFEADFGGEKFDGIHMSHVLEHLPDPNAAMERLKYWIKPDGWLYIEVPLQFDGLLERLQRFRSKQKKFDVFSVHHCSFFTPDSMRCLIKNHGLELKSLSTYDPNKRGGRKLTLQRFALSMILDAANFFERGDIVSVWVKA